MFPSFTKRWWGSLDYPLYLPLHNLQMSIQHCHRGKSYDWQCSVIKMMRLVIVDYWRVTQTHQIDNYIILSDDYRRYSYSPDSAVEDSGRPSMSSTLPLPRSFMITMMTRMTMILISWFPFKSSSGPDRALLPMKTTVGTRFSFVKIAINFHNNA